MASGYSRCAKPKAGPVLRTAPASTGFTLPSLDLPHVRCCLGSLQLLTGISLAVIAFPCLESSANDSSSEDKQMRRQNLLMWVPKQEPPSCTGDSSGKKVGNQQHRGKKGKRSLETR
uniref:uncharacterized protein LOC106994423 isoform X2 n=1 Tax=Macaca mulatta TaxID=9544 RepID=UPI0010A2570F|nr:uncharacterized protein LOC106994423 isoform X2 [Macaca mulatta]